MQPWIALATAEAPDGDTLRLMKRGDEFSIRLTGGNELMSSRLSGSEEALARLAIDERSEAASRVLIGGLGMGFTLRAALAICGEAACIDVAEIVPELLVWARGPMAPLFGGCLDDPRVRLHVADVRDLIGTADGRYDAILLDVDNGPDGITRPGNDALYGDAGLRAARRALGPGGVLAVWSAHPCAAFTRRLDATGFRTRVETVRAGRTKRGARHTIWLAERPSP